MKNTKNYGFNLPERGEFYNVEDFNENFEGIDTKLKEFESEYALQSAVDNIQTINTNTFGGAGWYRIAERDGNSRISNDSCFIELKRASSIGEVHLIRLESTNVGQRFNIVSSKVDTMQTISTIRYAYDSSKTYIEVYINHAGTYGYLVNLFDIAHGGTAWKALPFVATSETVSGVTVTTTYDIPANAIPVTVNKDRIFSNNGTKVMGIHNTNSAYTLFTFYGQNAELGSLGFDGVNNPMYRGADGKTGTLLHTGNKPSGTYIGNGSATLRTIDTGGVGNMVIVLSENTIAFVTEKGAFYQNNAGTFDRQDTGSFVSGSLRIATTDLPLNANGNSFYYYVV